MGAAVVAAYHRGVIPLETIAAGRPTPAAGRAVALVLCQWSEASPDSPPIWNVPITTPLLARVLREGGWGVNLFDTRLFARPAGAGLGALADAVARAVLDTRPAVVGFSFLSPSASLARAVAVRVRELSPETALVAGGTHCTVAPTVLTDCYDLVIRGEGEEEFPALASRVADGWRPVGADRVVRTRTADLSRSAVTVGADWAPYTAVQRGVIPPPKAALLELGRGCPFRCTFCEVADKDNFPAARRARPPEVVVAEARRWRDEYGCKYFLFIDSIATTAPGFATTFEALRRELDAPDIAIHLNSALPVFDEDVARVVSAHRGPVIVYFGMETASDRLGRVVLKGKHQPAATRRALDLCDRYGIDVGLNVIFGFDGETDADRAATLRLLEARRVFEPNPNILNPLPGTPLYHSYRERGILRDPDDLSIWMAARIRAAGCGPVSTVDYAAVLAAYDTAMTLRGSSRRGWPTWQSTPPAE